MWSIEKQKKGSRQPPKETNLKTIQLETEETKWLGTKGPWDSGGRLWKQVADWCSNL